MKERERAMQLFIDTFDVELIREFVSMGIIDGVTTNPSLFAKAGGDFNKTLKEICRAVSGPVSAQVTGDTATIMLKQAKELLAISENIVIKVPLNMEGLKACKQLSQKGHAVNVTLCFSAAQALLAAKAGATYISPFVGRLDDCGEDGMQLVYDICQVYANYPEIKTQVLAASIRHVNHVIEAAKAGAHVATVPANVLKQMFYHPLTDKGMESFHADWKKVGQTANW
jgi:transaldolase